MSVLDQSLGWGDCDLTPDLVTKEVKVQAWMEPEDYRKPNPIVDAADSVFDITGAELPMRALIVRRMLQNSEVDKPWKSWFDYPRGKGWLVVTETGWRFFPQEHR